jgi:hypothetical protein
MKVQPLISTKNYIANLAPLRKAYEAINVPVVATMIICICSIAGIIYMLAELPPGLLLD